MRQDLGIPYGFDLSRLGRPEQEARDRARSELGLRPETFVVGWVGRLTPIKRPEDLIRTLAWLARAGRRSSGGDGDGPDRAAVKLRGRARCRRAMPPRRLSAGHERLVRPLRRIRAHLRERGHAGWSHRGACQRLPVATHAGGTASVARNGESGYIVPIGDTEALAAKLAELARHPERARELGSLAPSTCASGLRWNRWSTGSTRSTHSCCGHGGPRRAQDLRHRRIRAASTDAPSRTARARHRRPLPRPPGRGQCAPRFFPSSKSRVPSHVFVAASM